MLAATPPELGELAASAGDDGAVCLLALPAGACARTLPGPPGRGPPRLAWAPALGYLAALYARVGGGSGGGHAHDAVAIVWDVQSGMPTTCWACVCACGCFEMRCTFRQLWRCHVHLLGACAKDESHMRTRVR